MCISNLVSLGVYRNISRSSDKSFLNRVERKYDTPHTTVVIRCYSMRAPFLWLAKYPIIGKNTLSEELRSSEKWKQGNTLSRFLQKTCFRAGFFIFEITVVRMAWSRFVLPSAPMPLCGQKRTKE